MLGNYAKQGEAACKKCRVELHEENSDIATVYMLTRRQYITVGRGRIVDISIPAIKAVMDLLNVKNQKDCLMKVMKLFHHFEGSRQK